MINEDKIKKLIDMGASRWSKGGRDRLYLNRAYKELLNMKVSRYNSGNISNATIGGEDISNIMAARIIEFSRITYIDIIKDEVVVDGMETTRSDEFKKLIEEAIGKL